MRPAMPRERMMLPRMAVVRRVWFVGKCRFDFRLRSLGNELVLLGEVHKQWSMKAVDLAEILLGVTAVIDDRSVDSVAHGRQEGHHRAEAIAEDGNLASAIGQFSSSVKGV